MTGRAFSALWNALTQLPGAAQLKGFKAQEPIACLYTLRKWKLLVYWGYLGIMEKNHGSYYLGFRVLWLLVVSIVAAGGADY